MMFNVELRQELCDKDVGQSWENQIQVNLFIWLSFRLEGVGKIKGVVYIYLVFNIGFYKFYYIFSNQSFNLFLVFQVYMYIYQI